MIAFDRDLRCTTWSPGMERISGVPALDVLGRVLHDKMFPFPTDVLRSVLVGEPVTTPEQPYRVSATGCEGVFEGSYFPVRDGRGAVTGGMGIIRDVAERQRADQEVDTAGRRFALLAEAGGVLAASLDYATTLARVAELAVPQLADWCLVHVVEGDGRLREMASALVDPTQLETARQLERSRPIEAGGNAIFRVLETGRPELVAEVDDVLLAATVPNPKDLAILRRLGPRSYMVVPMIARGRTLGAISFVSTTSGRRFQAGDLALAAELAHRAAFAIDNARLYRELRDLDRRKDEFLAMLGHELRNPLGAIRTALQVVNHAASAPDEVTRQRAIIDRQMRHLARLVDDLLDVSRLMSGTIVLERQTVDLNEVARHCLMAIGRDARAQEHDLSLSVHAVPLEMSGDPVRLEQMLLNLVDNALKFTPAGGRIDVSVAREGDRAVIRVRDTGVGIDRAILPHVFDLFMRGEATLARSPGGLGLGLTLVRKLAELHAGSVSVHSEGAGRGAEFLVSLPVDLADAQGAPPENDRAEPGPPARRVLVIEDNPDAREALRALLRLWGHDVEVAEDGPRGFEIAVATRPDIVVVDIGLPGLDGYHVAHGIRAALGDVFLVALTGYGQPDDRRRALEAGFDLHLVKPVDPDVLNEALARAPVS